MATCFSHSETLTKQVAPPGSVSPARPSEMKIALLTGGFDKPYAFGLAMALASKGVDLDVIGSDDVDDPQLHSTPKLNFLNLRGSSRQASLATKIARVLIYYWRLIRYAAVADAQLFHILWNNKVQFFDRTLLMLYYKLVGKKIVLTAHNVNAGIRDSNDSLLNRVTLRAQYLLADHIFVHTEQMKRELLQDFRVPAATVSVIPFGINNSVPQTDLTAAEAKQRLGIRPDEKTILFFGAIRPYKGIEFLVESFRQLSASHPEYRLVIAGEPRKENERYWEQIQRTMNRCLNPKQVTRAIRFVSDNEVELYFKAADVLALPYTHIFQSGVLFLAYSFGLPVVATDVGAIREDLIDGRTGFLCKPCDSTDLARAIERYFDSDLFMTLGQRRQEITDYAGARHSWEIIGQRTQYVYAELLGKRR
jgi:D-inositol-3-phosphate glycosyltransferase